MVHAVLPDFTLPLVEILSLKFVAPVSFDDVNIVLGIFLVVLSEADDKFLEEFRKEKP